MAAVSPMPVSTCNHCAELGQRIEVNSSYLVGGFSLKFKVTEWTLEENFDLLAKFAEYHFGACTMSGSKSTSRLIELAASVWLRFNLQYNKFPVSSSLYTSQLTQFRDTHCTSSLDERAMNGSQKAHKRRQTQFSAL